MVAWLERHQVPLYLATMVLGAALGLAFPAVTSTWEPAVPPLIAVLLWSTFLGIPLTQLGDGLRDRRFLLVLLGTAISRSSEDTETNQQASQNLAEPNEPLAELGVAPGQDADNNSDAQRNAP